MNGFRKLTKNDVDAIAPYFEREKSTSCDCTTGACFIWRDYFETEFVIVEDTLIFKISENGEKKYTYPIGKNIDRAFEYIEAEASESNTPLDFFISSEKDLLLIKDRYPRCTVFEKRDYFDYIYDYQALATFKGKKLSGQRNHVNKFKRIYPNYSFEEINEKNAQELIEFFKCHIASSEKDTPAIKAEAVKIIEIIKNIEYYRQFGGLLRVDGDIVGFSIAEKIGQTMFTHIEKADISYAGVYQMLVSQFASHFADENTVYINREDDAGDEGLRKSKLSYHPLFLIPKYIVSLR